MTLIPTLLLLTAATAMGAASEDPIDDFSPMLFLFVLLALAAVLIVFAIGLVLALIIVACCLALISLGIISTAALTGIFHRKFSAGLRALHYQICAAIALPAGIGIFWAGLWLFSSDMPLPGILIIGSAAGICAGLVVAFVLDRAAGIVYGHFAKRKSALADSTELSTEPNLGKKD